MGKLMAWEKVDSFHSAGDENVGTEDLGLYLPHADIFVSLLERTMSSGGLHTPPPKMRVQKLEIET